MLAGQREQFGSTLSGGLRHNAATVAAVAEGGNSEDVHTKIAGLEDKLSQILRLLETDATRNEK